MPRPKNKVICDVAGCDVAAHSKGKCRRHYQNMLYHAKRAAKNGSDPAREPVPAVRKVVAPAEPVERKSRAAKSTEPDALALLREEARRQRDGVVQAAEARYAKTLEAIEIVAELSRTDE